MKLLLISPRRCKNKHEFLDMRSNIFGIKHGCPALALPTIAALTPSNVETQIVDENIESINYDIDIDLVGITFFTSQAPRAYEISEEFIKRGKTVVFGGYHATVMKEEAIKYANSIVLGEAEYIWEEVINDFRNNQLKKFYEANEKPDLRNLPIPRWNLLKYEKYALLPLQTSRGCIFDCDFCSVKVLLGDKYRFKPIENVINEIKGLQAVDPKKAIFFTDDNFTANPVYTKKLLSEIKKLKLRSWTCQASVVIAKDIELLSLISDAGCKQIFIGFESLSEESLISMNKSKVNKVEEYLDVVRKIHELKMDVFAAFMIGGDGDDASIFVKTLDFIKTAKNAFSLISILTPVPGTRLYERYKNENRIIENDWSKYNGANVCFKPKKIDAKNLQDGYYWLLREIYSYNALSERLAYLSERGILTVQKNISIAESFIRRLKFIFGVIKTGDMKTIEFAFKNIFGKNKLTFSSILLSRWFHDYSYKYIGNKQGSE